MATYPVEIFNQPLHVIGLNARHRYLILLPVKDAAELVVKIGQRPVEATESLQYRGA